MCRNLYIRKLLQIFLLSGSLPDLELSVFSFPLLSLSVMYWGLGWRHSKMLDAGRVERLSLAMAVAMVGRVVGCSQAHTPRPRPHLHHLPPRHTPRHHP